MVLEAWETTVAKAVLAKMDLNNYNYTSLQLHQEEEQNDFIRLQQSILQECFPFYYDGKLIMLRNWWDGADHIREACNSQKQKPIFIFIDNALRSADLKKLLPEDLEALPYGSRIVITTRNLAVTDYIMFEAQYNIVRRSFLLQPLSNEDASKILLTEAETIEEDYLNRILKICSGVPLALKVVGDCLHKSGNCESLLQPLEKGETIEEEKLSERLVDFVYGELEEYAEEALLDICCFFNKCNRKDVEHMVGDMAITSLLEVGLITSTQHYLNCPLWERLIVPDIIRVRGQHFAKDNRISDVKSLRDAADNHRLNQIKGVWLLNDKSEYIIEERHLNLMRDSLRVLALGEQIKVRRVSQMWFTKLEVLVVPHNTIHLPVMLGKLDRLRVVRGPIFTEDETSFHMLPESLLSMKVSGPFHPSTEYTRSKMTGTPPLQRECFNKLMELPRLPEELISLILDCNKKMWELLPDLEVLSIMHSNLDCLPESFGKLTALRVLNLAHCARLHTFPNTFGQLFSLKTLILDCNSRMWELPEQICQLPSLNFLSLMYSNISCLPESFGQLVSLTCLKLAGCQLESLPGTFGKLTALRFLNLSHCTKLKALPDTFGQLSALTDLNLSHCPLLEVLPDSFGQLLALTNLNLSNCPLLEVLPETSG